MQKRKVSFFTHVRLSVMMFLQFAIWGAWAVLIAGHMENLGFSGKQLSYVFGTTAIGAIISPIITAILFFILFNERKYQEDADTIGNDTDTSN